MHYIELSNLWVGGGGIHVSSRRAQRWGGGGGGGNQSLALIYSSLAQLHVHVYTMYIKHNVICKGKAWKQENTPPNYM